MPDAYWPVLWLWYSQSRPVLTVLPVAEAVATAVVVAAAGAAEALAAAVPDPAVACLAPVVECPDPAVECLGPRVAAVCPVPPVAHRGLTTTPPAPAVELPAPARQTSTGHRSAMPLAARTIFRARHHPTFLAPL